MDKLQSTAKCKKKKKMIIRNSRKIMNMYKRVIL